LRRQSRKAIAIVTTHYDVNGVLEFNRLGEILGNANPTDAT
jgi:hypothetical protein